MSDTEPIDVPRTALLNELRLILDQGEVSSDSMDFSRAEDLLVKYSNYLSTMFDLKSNGYQHAEQAHIDQALRPWLLNSDIVRHIYHKPLGYAGDFQLIQKIYENIAKGEDRKSKRLDHFFLNTVPAYAVRNRRSYLADCIRKIGENHPPAQRQILSLACGPATEIFDALNIEQIRKQVHFHLVDIDPRAIAFVRTKAQSLGVESNISLHRNDITRFLINGSDNVALKDIDLAYSIGLIDYFDERHVLRLMNFVHSILRPGGKLILGNFHPNNPLRGFMDHVLDWKLIHRTEQEMNDLCRQSAFQRDFDQIDFEPTGINLFATIGKATDSEPPLNSNESANRQSDMKARAT